MSIDERERSYRGRDRALRVCLITFIALVGCGRVSFEPLLVPDGDIVDTATDALPPCVVDGLDCASGTAFTCGSTCFAICIDKMESWAAGLDRCSRWGGSLAHLEDLATQACFALNTNDTWIGYVQTVDADSLAMGWSWLDGRSRPFVEWNAGEPNDADGNEDGAEQCAILSSGGWNDHDCIGSKRTSCSCPAP